MSIKHQRKIRRHFKRKEQRRKQYFRGARR